MKCNVGCSIWISQKQKRMLPTTEKVSVQCRFRVEFARKKSTGKFILSNFFFHHSHPLSLEYER